MEKKKIGFNRVDVLPEWSENIVGAVYFVKDTGVYIANDNGFELSATAVNKDALEGIDTILEYIEDERNEKIKELQVELDTANSIIDDING
jgi:hypothetical protein